MSRGGPPGRRPAEPSSQVEGRQAVRELLAAGRRRVHHVLVSDAVDASKGPIAEIVDLARAKGVPVQLVPRARLQSVAATDSPQGVVATADPIAETTLEELVAGTGALPPFLVVLDGVTDPHNVGAVARSALCAGATGLVLRRHRSAHVTPAVAKAAAGAIEHLRVAVVGGIPAALIELSRAGVWTVGLDASGARALWDLEVGTEAVAVVLGGEGRGLSRLTRERCDLVVGIPMDGPLASLNVGAAATLACFEVARVRAREHSRARTSPGV